LATFELGISSRGGCLWSTDKDDRKLVSILAHCVNSVSDLALDFGYGLSLDFFISYATCKLTAAMCFAVQNQQLIAAVWCKPYFLPLYSLYCNSKGQAEQHYTLFIWSAEATSC
jgi:hypothetical protein